MNKLLFVLSLFLLTNEGFSQDEKKSTTENKVEDAEELLKGSVEKDQNGPIMTFESKEVDYGTIDQHSEPLRVLKFTNTGNEPLIIKNARGSCGCTVADWPKEPVLPGEESKIEIRYATNRLGKINKTIKITTNEESSAPHVIRVIGKVLKKEVAENVPSSEPSILNQG